MLEDSLKIEEVKTKIGKIIRIKRKSARITQNELGDKLGISRITIQNLESGRNITIDTLLKALTHLDDLDELNSRLDFHIRYLQK